MTRALLLLGLLGGLCLAQLAPPDHARFTGERGVDHAEPPPGAPPAAALLYGRPIDLNAAGAADLAALPGIGAGRAAAILDARAARGGRFASVEELLDVPGIGPATLARLRPLVAVN